MLAGRRTTRWAALATAALLVTSCGGDDHESEATASDSASVAALRAPGGATAPSGAPDATTAASNATEPSAAPAASSPTGASTTTDPLAGADIDEDGVLRYGYYIALSTFDPHKSNGSNDNAWLFPVYDRLVHTTAGGEPEPGLAESWEFADDGSYLELHLREGVTFHDGEPFDAEAVKANIERAQTLEGSTMVTLLDNVTEVEVVDDLTVRLHTDHPDATLPLILSDRPGAMISPAAFDAPDLGINPVGAGAFRVVEHRVEDVVVYERFEDYWNREATHLARLEISVQVDTTTRLSALRSGQLDAAEIDPTQVADAEAAGLDITLGTDVSFLLLQFNSELRPEFADERVRLAINHAIDRQGIVDSILLGHGEPAVQIFPSGNFAHSPDVPADLYPYDPDRARELLAEAGYADGFSFEIATTSTPSRVLLSEIIQAQLGAIGIQTTIRQYPTPGQFLDDVYTNKTSEAWVLAWGGRADPAITADGLFGAGSFNNPSGLTTDEVTRLLEESITVFDPEARVPILQELSAAIAEAALDVVVVYFPEKILATTEGVLGEQIWQVGRPEFRGMGVAAG